MKMSALDTYGFQSVNWQSIKLPVAERLIQQYHDRLAHSVDTFNDLDAKAKYGLTGMIGLTTALLAYTKANPAPVLLCLIAGFVVAAVLFLFSLWPRAFCGFGVTTSDMRLSEWADGLINEHAETEMIGVVICQYAANIAANEGSIYTKGQFIAAGISAAVGSLFLSAAVLIVGFLT